MPEMIWNKILIFLIITVVIGGITDLLFTVVIGYLKLDVPTLLAPLLVEGSLGKTQQGLITLIVPTIDLLTGVSSAAGVISWLNKISGSDD